MPAKVASLYYAADRLYNIHKINKELDAGYNVILDRYVGSNMAHQAGKIKDFNQKVEMIEFLTKLEYFLLDLPKPDMTIFLHMPYEASLKLVKNRTEKADQHEASPEHLKDAEETYLYLARRFSYKTISCFRNGKVKSINAIHKEIVKIFKKEFN